jgi:hypothetical protein
MDNIQDAEQAVPQGQAAPVEQVPTVQPVEVATVSEGPVETTFEELKAKKGFQSPDDLAKAYANLESHNKRVEMKTADMEKQFFPVESPRDIQPQSPASQAIQESQQALNELRKFVQTEVEPLKKDFDQRLQTELSKIELRQVMKENTDFGKYATDVKELKTRYPAMSFTEAYSFAKAMKGDSVAEAKSQAFQRGASVAQRQVAAQVAPAKGASEDKIPAQDLLQGASKRWVISPKTSPEQIARIKAEQSLIEREIFGEELKGFNR